MKALNSIQREINTDIRQHASFLGWEMENR